MTTQQGWQRRKGQTTPEVLHAVPPGDRTRSSLCGARVNVLGGAWPGAGPLCPECTSLALTPARG